MMLRRDRVDRVIDSPLNHPHVDLRCWWCSARRGNWSSVIVAMRFHFITALRRSRGLGRCADPRVPSERTDRHRVRQIVYVSCLPPSRPVEVRHLGSASLRAYPFPERSQYGVHRKH